VLPLYKKHQLQNRYKINDQYAIPSAFGIKKKRLEEYTIAPQESYYQTLIAKIN
jgi:hypothetical protein